MKRKVIVSVDSTADLPQEYVKRYDIKIIPLYVEMNGIYRRDYYDVDAEAITAYIDQTGKLTTTTAPSVPDYKTEFMKWTEQGLEVVHINMSEDLSCSHQNAVIAASELKGVYVLDSRTLSMGTGRVAMEAADLAEKGKSGQEIITELKTFPMKVIRTFVIDTLKNLAKSGRCSALSLLGANLLKIKPCIEIIDGKMSVRKRYRGNAAHVLPQFVRDQLTGKNKINQERLVIAHSGVSNELISLVKEQAKKIIDFKEIMVTSVGCVVAAHCGPRVLGLMFTIE